MNSSTQPVDRSGNFPVRSNRRRVGILVVVIFVALLSFFIGRQTHPKTYTGQESTSGNVTDPSGRAGIPPDSLSH